MAQDIFVASSENLKELKKHRNRLKCLVNRAIRENSLSELDSLTKVYALLYSAYVEVSFLKLIHTPKAFSDSENQLPRCKHSSAVLGSYVAAHSTCLSLLLSQDRKRGMKVCLSLFLHIIE